MKQLKKLIHKILHTDFCPSFNRYVYWMKQPLGWFALAAVTSLIIALFHSKTGWLMLVCCVGVIGLQLIWPWVQLKVCRCQIIFDRSRAEEWEEVAVQLRVTNRSPFPIWGLAIEEGFFAQSGEKYQGDDEGDSLAVTLSRVPPLSTNTYYWKFTPQRRGIYPLQTPKISTGFPFGIWTATKEVSVRGRLVAWPKTQVLNGIPSSSVSGVLPTGAMQDRAGTQGDILGSRLLRSGESLRMVNWAQSAKTEDDLVVLERQSCAQLQARVLLDLTPHSESNLQQVVSDWQVRMAASIVNHMHKHQFGLIVGYSNIIRQIGSSRQGIHVWFDELADLDETMFDSRTPVNRIADESAWVVTTVSGFKRFSGSANSANAVIVATREEAKLLQASASNFVINIDDERRDPFQQLATLWRAYHLAKQSA